MKKRIVIQAGDHKKRTKKVALLGLMDKNVNKEPTHLRCEVCKRMLPNQDEYWDLAGSGDTCNRCYKQQREEPSYNNTPYDETVQCNRCRSRYHPESHPQCPKCGG